MPKQDTPPLNEGRGRGLCRKCGASTTFVPSEKEKLCWCCGSLVHRDEDASQSSAPRAEQ